MGRPEHRAPAAPATGCSGRSSARALARRGWLVAVMLALAACGSGRRASEVSQVGGGPSSVPAARPHVPRAHPHALEPVAGAQAPAVTPAAPVGDPNAHAPSLKQVQAELRLQVVAVRVSNATYINPLPYVTCCGRWERTDQGVDATMPVGSPIVAPTSVKILGIEPNWYAGQPLVYYELLAGQDAGRIQYVAEQITQIPRPGTILKRGAPIARFASSGTGIEFGWSTLNGVTLARATTGYEEGQVTPAGQAIRFWLNSLGAGAGPS